VDSILHAVNLLGLDTVKALVLGVGVFSEFKTTPSTIFSVGALWDHSVTTAAYAKKIAATETNNKHLVDTVFIAGMMHDVGKLLLFSSLQDDYLRAVVMAREQGLPLCQSEQVVFNANHGNVGSYLMGLWGLPGGVVESIAFHHHLDTYPEPSFSPAVAIHAADVIYYQLNPKSSVGAPPVLNQLYLEQAGLGEKFGQWLTICREMQ
jgi:HD-like signal output (HDOD) protein